MFPSQFNRWFVYKRSRIWKKQPRWSRVIEAASMHWIMGHCTVYREVGCTNDFLWSISQSIMNRFKRLRCLIKAYYLDINYQINWIPSNTYLIQSYGPKQSDVVTFMFVWRMMTSGSILVRQSLQMLFNDHFPVRISLPKLVSV